jgi:hypothetical protein
MNFERAISIVPIKKTKKAALIKTTQVESMSSCRVDQETFFNSTTTSEKNLVSFAIIAINHTGLVGFEPTTHGFGDRCSASWSYRPKHRPILFFHFFVSSVLPAKTAILLQLNPFWLLLLIFRAAIIDPIAFFALKLNIFTHGFLLFQFHKPPTGIEPVTPSLPRTCSTG